MCSSISNKTFCLRPVLRTSRAERSLTSLHTSMHARIIVPDWEHWLSISCFVVRMAYQLTMLYFKSLLTKSVHSYLSALCENRVEYKPAIGIRELPGGVVTAPSTHTPPTASAFLILQKVRKK